MVRMCAVILFVASLFLTSFCVPLLAADCTVTVLPGESIQAAIDAAPDGATVCLAAGEWQENVAIAKPLTLRGAGADATIIKGLEAGLRVIRIESAEEIEATIADLTIAEAKLGEPRNWKEDGIHVGGQARVTITDCAVVENGWNGISVGGSAQATILNSIVRGSGGTGGVYVVDSAQVTLTGSMIERSGWNGVFVSNSAQATIVDLSVDGTDRDGITVGDSARATITGSTVNAAGWVGITVRDSAQATIVDSTVEGSMWRGIFVRDSAQATMARVNVIGSALDGIVIWGQATLDACKITGSGGFGVALYQRHGDTCADPVAAFVGYVAGARNIGDGNSAGNYCPEDLKFLFTEEGGELDRRE